MVTSGNVKIFDGSAHSELSQEIATYLGVSLGKVYHVKFSDGEIYCRIEESVRGKEVFVVQPTCPPVNDNLMRLLILIDALKRASAGSITAIIPYFGYARQEKKTTGREPITAKLVSNLITTAGATRVITIDLHDPAIQGFFDIPVDHLTAVNLLADSFKELNLSNAVVVSPDTGGVLRARAFANRLQLPLAIIDKRRPQANKAIVMNVIGDVVNKDTIIIDDIIDTAGTLVEVTDTLLKNGAKKVMACCTHAILSGDAVHKIANSQIEQIVVTNSVPIQENKRNKLKIISLAPLIGEAIKRIYYKQSISELFS